MAVGSETCDTCKVLGVTWEVAKVFLSFAGFCQLVLDSCLVGILP